MYRIDKIDVNGYTRYRVVKIINNALNKSVEKKVVDCTTRAGAEWVVDNMDKINLIEEVKNDI